MLSHCSQNAGSACGHNARRGHWVAKGTSTTLSTDCAWNISTVGSCVAPQRACRQPCPRTAHSVVRTPVPTSVTLSTGTYMQNVRNFSVASSSSLRSQTILNLMRRGTSRTTVAPDGLVQLSVDWHVLLIRSPWHCAVEARDRHTVVVSESASADLASVVVTVLGVDTNRNGRLPTDRDSTQD